MPRLIHFADEPPQPQVDRPSPERAIGPSPRRLTMERYRADDGAISMGDWACEPGAWAIDFHDRRHEFFQLLEGRIRLSDASGNAREFSAGDACIIPAGFKGIFEVLEPVRKRYVMLDWK